MKNSDFKKIVKDSLREAFYTPKKVLLEHHEYIGIVDSNGHIHSQKAGGDYTLDDYHMKIFPGIRGDRWRYFDDEIIWTNIPSEDSMFSVENFLIKRGENPKNHYQWTTKLKTVGEKALTNESLLFEELYGKRMTVNYFGKETKAVLSKNTKPGENPYRISWFRDVGTPEMAADGHFDLTEEEVKYVLENKKFPPSVYERIYINPKNFSIGNINESLYLLEQSSREIELWLDNKTVTL